MITTRNINGSYTFSELAGNHLFTRTYFFYTKREARRLFKAECEFKTAKRAKREVETRNRW